jgi:hypothetical protein
LLGELFLISQILLLVVAEDHLHLLVRSLLLQLLID